MRAIGLGNTVTHPDGWDFLIFYDVDGDREEADKVNDCFESFKEVSYIAYSTKHGYHFVGLSPVNADYWGCAHAVLQTVSRQYYSGRTIRLSRKDEEHQELYVCRIRDGTHVIPNLYGIYAKRFGIADLPQQFWASKKYKLLFETYHTKKE